MALLHLNLCRTNNVFLEFAVEFEKNFALTDVLEHFLFEEFLGDNCVCSRSPNLG